MTTNTNSNPHPHTFSTSDKRSSSSQTSHCCEEQQSFLVHPPSHDNCDESDTTTMVVPVSTTFHGQQQPSPPPSPTSTSFKRKSQIYVGCLSLLAMVTLAWLRREDLAVMSTTATTAIMEGGGTTENVVAVATSSAASVSNPGLRLVEEPTKIKKSTPTHRIRQISILGERNSGTRWTYDHISECFNTSVKVVKTLTRYKHWFQYPNATKYKHDTLVLAQFRNPYDWLKAMEHVPHHSPAHLRTKLDAPTETRNAENDWNIFLTKPWTMPRVGKDLELKGDEICQEDFPYRDLVSCVVEPLPIESYNHTLRYSEHQPFYEMRNDGSGLPYDNILEMRTDKIRNFLSVSSYPGIADVWVIQYEYLVNKGTEHLISKIQEITGLKPKCKPKPPQNRKSRKSRYVSPEFAEHVRKHLNWTVEEWIGYQIDETREQEPLEW